MGKSNNDLLLILKMLEEGKISGEEAAKLIEAIESQKEEPDKDKSDNMKDFDEAINGMTDMAKSIGRIGARVGKEILESIAEFDFSLTEYQTIHSEYELSEGAEILLDSNGKIRIQKNTGTGNLAQVKVQVPREDAGREEDIVIREYAKGRLEIRTEKSYKRPVMIEVLLPDMQYGKVRARGLNGAVECKGIAADELGLSATNGKVAAEGCQGKTMRISTTNGKIVIENCKGEGLTATTTNGKIHTANLSFPKEIKCTTTNGKVHAEMVASGKLDLGTTNGGITLSSGKTDQAHLTTTNGHIAINDYQPFDENRGKLKASTSNGGISFAVKDGTGVVFTADAGKHGNIRTGRDFILENQRYDGVRMTSAKGESRGLDSTPRSIEADLKTSMGTIDINWIS
ncbi:MAG: DUF4097 family beta strand repeat-containing protein [Clostridia bacterium]